METNCSLRHNIIKNRIAVHPETVVDNAIGLWEQMATEIISLVGEIGFNSLYARTIYLTQSTFPWIAANSESLTIDQPLIVLRMNFDRETPEHVTETNTLMLITFTDILASLIGEQLTTTILSSAWGKDASAGTIKELKNE